MKSKQYYIYILFIICISLTQVNAVPKTVRINQSVYVDVFTNESGFIRNAKLIIPPNSWPTGPRALSQVYTATESGTFDYSYEVTVDIECNTTLPVWDIGQNITRILNQTTYLYNYQVKDKEECKDVVQANIELNKQVEYLQERLGELEQFDTLKSAYDVCSKDKEDCETELKTYKDDLKQSNGKHINFFIGGIVVAGALLFITRRNLFYKSPAEKEGWRR